jgi:hypothetical protein
MIGDINPSSSVSFAAKKLQGPFLDERYSTNYLLTSANVGELLSPNQYRMLYALTSAKGLAMAINVFILSRMTT